VDGTFFIFYSYIDEYDNNPGIDWIGFEDNLNIRKLHEHGIINTKKLKEKEEQLKEKEKQKDMIRLKHLQQEINIIKNRYKEEM